MARRDNEKRPLALPARSFIVHAAARLRVSLFLCPGQRPTFIALSRPSLRVFTIALFIIDVRYWLERVFRVTRSNGRRLYKCRTAQSINVVRGIISGPAPRRVAASASEKGERAPEEKGETSLARSTEASGAQKGDHQ